MKRKMMMMALLSTSVIAFAGPKADSQESEHMNKLLAESKTEAMTLSRDAQELETYTRGSGVGWQTHAAKLTQMKEHVNKAGELVQELNNSKNEGAQWQQTAVDRITPALRELADNLQSTIETLNKNQSRVNVSPYKDYAVANSELATNLAQVVSDFVSYGHTKQKFEQLGDKLEIDHQ